MPDPRLEKIAGRLHRTIVASAEFAGNSGGAWADLGEFPIAGFSKAERVYGLADESSPGIQQERYSSGSVVNSSG